MRCCSAQRLWSEGWGVDKIFDAETRTIPHVQLSCEDYGLVFRLAAEQPGTAAPARRANRRTWARCPVFNVVAEIKGSEKPDEYVVLSAHLDSWDGASGATDNGTGTVMMLEAMRLLKPAYPQSQAHHPGRHWSGEEQG